MKFIAKATSVNEIAVWEGFYAELKQGYDIAPVIIDKEGNSHKIIPSTLKYYTGIMTEKAQPIYEGDNVEVFDDCEVHTGIVRWSGHDARWVIEDDFGEYHDLVGDTRYFVK